MDGSRRWGVSYDCLGDGGAGTAYGGCPVVGPKFSNAVVRYSSIATDYFPNASAPAFLNTTLQTKVRLSAEASPAHECIALPYAFFVILYRTGETHGSAARGPQGAQLSQRQRRAPAAVV